MVEKNTDARSDKADVNVARIATIAASAAIGSAAIAAAVLFTTRRRDGSVNAEGLSAPGAPGTDRTPRETD
jgi:hypothetical protein